MESYSANFNKRLLNYLVHIFSNDRIISWGYDFQLPESKWRTKLHEISQPELVVVCRNIENPHIIVLEQKLGKIKNLNQLRKESEIDPDQFGIKSTAPVELILCSRSSNEETLKTAMDQLKYPNTIIWIFENNESKIFKTDGAKHIDLKIERLMTKGYNVPRYSTHEFVICLPNDNNQYIARKVYKKLGQRAMDQAYAEISEPSKLVFTIDEFRNIAGSGIEDHKLRQVIEKIGAKYDLSCKIGEDRYELNLKARNTKSVNSFIERLGKIPQIKSKKRLYSYFD